MKQLEGRVFALLSSHFQVKPTHSLHTTTDKLSRHAYTLPCPVRGGSYYDAVDCVHHDASESIACLLLYKYVWVSLGNAMKAKQSKAKQKQSKSKAKSKA
jgi:hypothetical protein